MQDNPSLNNLVEDEFCLTSLSPEDADIWKQIAEAKELPNLILTGVYLAQELSKGESVKIAVIDSGVDYTHPELSSRFFEDKGKNIIDETSEPLDQNGHGTNVAGIIAGKSMGIAPLAKIYAFKVMCSQAGIAYEKINKALEASLDYRVDLINLSISAGTYNKECEFLCKKACENGILVVASAGNNYSGAGFPAAYGIPVIGVASVTDSKSHVLKSNIWSTNDLCAPGSQIFSCYMDGRYCLSGGTSMASAQITGILALGVSLLKQKRKNISPDMLESILKSTAEPLSQEVEKIALEYGITPDLSKEQSKRWIYGAGLVRADRFIEEVNKI